VIKKGAVRFFTRKTLIPLRNIEEHISVNNDYQVDGNISLINRQNIIDKILYVLRNDMPNWKLNIIIK